MRELYIPVCERGEREREEGCRLRNSKPTSSSLPSDNYSILYNVSYLLPNSVGSQPLAMDLWAMLALGLRAM